MTAPDDRVIPQWVNRLLKVHSPVGHVLGTCWCQDTGHNPALPVTPGTVAVLRLPMPVDGLVALNAALAEAYGPDLVIVTDAGLDGWMVVARKDDPEDLDSVRARRAAGGR